MSELAEVKGTPTDAEARSGADQDASNREIGQLDEEATALLKELEDSHLEVQRMLEEQRAQAQELGGIKEHLSAELLQLRDDAWKLHLFAELEMLKRQLAAINSLDADLDAMEAKLDADEGEQDDDSLREALAAAQAGTRDMLSRLGGPASKPKGLAAVPGAESVSAGPSTSAAAAAADDATAADGSGKRVSAEADKATAAAGADGKVEEEDVEDVEALQQELDAELAAMMQQLQAIKAESAMVAARKAQLELELMQLMRDEADDLTSQLRDLGVGEEEVSASDAPALPTDAPEPGGGASVDKLAAGEPPSSPPASAPLSEAPPSGAAAT